LERKRQAGAQAMQSFFRGSYTRSKYLKRISKVQKATTIIWTSYRRWQERIELQKWLDVKVEETRQRKEEERKKREEEERQRKLEEERLRCEEEKRLAALKAEERKAEEEAKLEAARKERELERQRKLEEARLLREEEEKKRLEERKIQEEKEAEEMRLAKERKEAEDQKLREQEERKLEMEIEQRRRSMENNSIKIREEKQRKKEEEHQSKREQLQEQGRKHREQRIAEERKIKEEAEEKMLMENFPELYQNRDYDLYDDPYDYAPSVQEQLKNFSKIAATGQLFLKYTGKRRRKPQDRIVKVSWTRTDNKYRPKQISWGSGSRHIDFSDILYISWGHWTPVFEARKDQLKEDMCFSVVGKQQILDVQAQSKEMAELWVKGLRKLIGQSDEEADHRARKWLNYGSKD